MPGEASGFSRATFSALPWDRPGQFIQELKTIRRRLKRSRDHQCDSLVGQLLERRVLLIFNGWGFGF
jgi:hypothetical protein